VAVTAVRTRPPQAVSIDDRDIIDQDHDDGDHL
jgi:hypothetical protein